MMYLCKSDTERLRLSKVLSTLNTIPVRKIHNTKHNPSNHSKWNPINNTKCHDKAMSWKVKQALFHDHSPQTSACHVGNVTDALSSPEAQTVINTTDVVIHYFAFSHGDITIENAGHGTTNHRFVVDVPVNPSTFHSTTPTYS